MIINLVFILVTVRIREFEDEKMEELDNILSNGMGLLDGVQAYDILTGRK